MPRAFRLASELTDPRGRELWAQQLQQSSKVPTPLLVMVRVLLALSMDLLLAWDYWLFHGQSYGLYLTHWALIIECVYLTIGAVTSVCLVVGVDVPQAALALNSVLATLVFPCTMLVTVLFWVLDFPKWTITLAEYMAIFPTGVLKHGVNFLAMCIDFALVEQPLFMADALYPILFATTYVSFNAWYFLAGGRTVSGGAYTYAVLDWTRDLTAAAKVAAAVLLIVVPLASLLPGALTQNRGRALSRRLSELSLPSSEDSSDQCCDVSEDCATTAGESEDATEFFDVADVAAAAEAPKEFAFVKEKLKCPSADKQPRQVTRARRFLQCLNPSLRQQKAVSKRRLACCLSNLTE